MIRLVAMREISARGTTRLYLGLTALVALAPFLALVAADRFGGDDGPREVDVGVVGEVPTEVEIALTSFPPSGLEITFVTVQDESSLSQALVEGDVAVGIDDEGLWWESSVDPELDAVLRGAIQSARVIERAEAAGIEAATLAEVVGVEAPGERFVEHPGDGDDVALEIAGVITTMLVFFSVQVYGALMLMGVVEEKASRVIEVLLPHVSPRQLLAGKTLGLGALAVGQLVALLVGLAAGLAATGGLDVPSNVLRVLPLFIACWIGGFALYSAIFAAAGSLVSRQEDAQQASLPLVLPLMAGYVIGLSAPDDSVVGSLAAIFPFTGPMVLPGRIANGAASSVEIGLSFAALLGGIWLVLTVGGRIYSAMLLRTGTRVKWTEAFRALGRRTSVGGD